jgi:hypothetical protein
MAIEDYFKGSSQAYGQLAGSLLAGRRKQDKKEAKRALIASTVMSTFGALQNKQKQDIIDATNEVNTKYQDIFDNNEEIFNKKQQARADFLSYKENPNSYIEKKAKELFNQDLDLQAKLGTNPYSQVSKADLTPESYTDAMELLEEKRKEAKNYIESQAGNAAVTTQTFTKFNAAAKEEYEAAMDAVKDDPYKQGLIRSTFSRIFGAGEEKKAKLITTLETAERKRLNQEATIPYMDTVKGREELINKQIIEGTEKVENEGFAYDTKTLKLERDNKAILKSIEDAKFKNILPDSDEEKELESTIINAYRKGLKVSKIKELDEIQENNLPAFVSAFTKVERIRDNAPDMDPTDFLSIKERDLYDLGMGITRDDINAVEEIRNEENRLEVVSQINSMIGTGDETGQILSMIDGNFGTDGKDATGLSSVYVSNVIRAKTHLMNKYDMDDIEALQTAMDMQLEGVSKETGGSYKDPASRGWWKRKLTITLPSSGIEYVNPDVENLPIIPDTANIHAQNLNEYTYLQNRSYTDDEGNKKTLRPDEVGKEYTVDNEDFTVSFIVEQVNNNLKWVPSVTYK